MKTADLLSKYENWIYDCYNTSDYTAPSKFVIFTCRTTLPLSQEHFVKDVLACFRSNLIPDSPNNTQDYTLVHTPYSTSGVFYKNIISTMARLLLTKRNRIEKVNFKNCWYYGNMDMILDSEFTVLYCLTRTIEKHHNSIQETGITAYFNPNIFISQNPVEKFLTTHLLPHLLFVKTPICSDNIEKISVKIDIPPVSLCIPENPVFSNCTTRHLWNCLKLFAKRLNFENS